MKREDLFKNQKRANRYKIPFMDTWLEKEQQRSVELEKHLVEKGYPQYEVNIDDELTTIYYPIDTFHAKLWYTEWKSFI